MLLTITCHEKNGSSGFAQYLSRKLQSVHPWHHNIGEHEVYTNFTIQELYCLATIACLNYVVAFVGKDSDQDRANFILVLDNKKLFGLRHWVGLALPG